MDQGRGKGQQEACQRIMADIVNNKATTRRNQADLIKSGGCFQPAIGTTAIPMPTVLAAHAEILDSFCTGKSGSTPGSNRNNSGTSSNAGRAMVRGSWFVEWLLLSVVCVWSASSFGWAVSGPPRRRRPGGGVVRLSDFYFVSSGGFAATSLC